MDKVRKPVLVHVGTRGSQLALAQTQLVIKALLAKHPELRLKTVVIRTTGDRITSAAKLRGLMKRGELKGVFVKEIERALLRREVDLAIHSLKDLPTTLAEGLEIGAVLPREPANDLFVGRTVPAIERLPKGAKVGTSSVRRQAFLHKHYGIEAVELRGNLDTRLAKLTSKGGNLDGIVVAAAGVQRLAPALNGLPTQSLPLEKMVPAPGQGALAIEIRSRHPWIRDYLASIHDAKTASEVAAERALQARLEGGCTLPLGAHARLEEGEILHLHAAIADPTGERYIDIAVSGEAADPDGLARAAETYLRSRGAAELIHAAVA